MEVGNIIPTLYIDGRNNCGWIAIEAIKISVEEFDSLEATAATKAAATKAAAATFARTKTFV
jgi:hypothetical protein